MRLQSLMRMKPGKAADRNRVDLFMKFILHYLREYRFYAIMAPLFKMLEAIFELLVPLVVARIIDVGIASGDQTYIAGMSVVLLGLALTGTAVSITAQFFAAKAAVCSAGRMRQDLFEHIQDFSDSAMDGIGSATLLTRLTSDLNQVQGGINMVLRLFLRSPFVVLGATFMAGTISLRAMGLFWMVILVLMAVVAGLMSCTIPLYQQVQQGLEGLLVLTGENLEGARVLRAFARGDQERALFHERNAGLNKTAYRAGRLQSYLNPLTTVVVNLAVIVLLWRGGYAVQTGVLSTGKIVALYNYLSQILVELVKFATLIVQITRAYASLGRVCEVMEAAADERIHGRSGVVTDADAQAVVFSDVTFAYSTGDRALEEISFCVPAGTSVGIVGGTGAGKSTIARLMRHAYDADSGEVLLFGQNVNTFSDSAIAALIANVPQKSELFSGTVAENLRLGAPAATDAQLKQALSVAQAYDFVMEKGGLGAEVQVGGTNFSGGQRQRLCIARALCMNPRILIMDDATSALDAATERALLAALKEQRGLTTVILSQRSTAVKDASQILVMDGGWCIGGGTHEELLVKNDVYREIYEAGL